MIENNKPKLDLHGLDREISRIKVKEFINDNYKLKNKEVLIVHGIGTGVLKKVVHETLKSDKKVEKYYQSFFNLGCTFVELNIKN